MFRRMLLSVLLLGLSAPILPAQTTPSPALLALAKRDRTLAIIDPTTLKIVAKIPCGPDPHEVIASSDGKLAFVSNYGGGAWHTISVIDLVAQKPLTEIDLTPLSGAHGLAFAGGKLYFTAEVNKVIGRYDPATQKVDWILGTGQNRTHMVYVTPDLDHIYTSNVSSGTISLIEKTMLAQGGPPPGGPGGPPPMPNGGSGPPPPPPGPPRPDWNETVLPAGHGSEGFDVSPDGRELWAASAGDGTITVIDIPGKKVAETLQADVRGANRLKFTLDGKLVFVSSLFGGEVTVIDTATRKVVKRIKVGRGAAGILMDPNGQRAFVAASPDNSIAVIDLKTLAITGHIEPGTEPDGMAWAVRQ